MHGKYTITCFNKYHVYGLVCKTIILKLNIITIVINNHAVLIIQIILLSGEEFFSQNYRSQIFLY